MSLGPLDIEIGSDDQLVKLTYHVGKLGKVKREVTTKPLHAMWVFDERDEQDNPTGKAPMVECDTPFSFEWRVS